MGRLMRDTTTDAATLGRNKRGMQNSRPNGRIFYACDAGISRRYSNGGGHLPAHVFKRAFASPLPPPPLFDGLLVIIPRI